MTVPCDRVYMRVTDRHIVFSIVTGFSAFIAAEDVRALDTDPPEEMKGYGQLVVGVLRAHHPADPDHVTRSYSFRFPVDSPLLPAIYRACPQVEPPVADEEAAPNGNEPAT
jgi:hypothetical protein